MADKAMVRKLSACEAMGFATTICTDNTGTLTLNQMKVTMFWHGLEPVEDIQGAYSKPDPFVLQLIQEGVALNTTELNMETENLTRSCSIIHVETFNSKKKRSGVLLRRNADNTINAHWKGGAEMILKMCSRYYDASGIVKNLDSDSMMKFEHIIQGMAASSLRCIAFTYVEVAEEEVGDEEGKTMVKVKENGLTLLGLVGIKDSCRPEVKKAVEACQHAVAVTGDGTNDAPALKEADIGLSMGIQGTEVAKESSDIVILGDNFASVVSVVKWGRCSYNNIQKFIQFQLTVNIAALAINFVAAVLVGKLPHSAVQLLWVNLIMDTLGALALATEKATIELMYKPAVGRTNPLITNVMWRNILAQALYQIAVSLTLQLRGESLLGVTQGVNDTLVFHTFVWVVKFLPQPLTQINHYSIFTKLYVSCVKTISKI
ncbi:hypothetical protein VNO78_33698 [Psophocarpus tetragonolobus]|uniref:Cation-transporting P-type ATPase C-terminal domain-containing protein n=1 Tax=Psophocarpus tetragonolobus TaxID=3891 RepID=A0AAN9RQB2_PSOTE